ncbi:hypothetical protein BV22DRAFT_1101368 [Leucogyrophana mollusca]|uniref:Uncharacterized protein n=1 Tax=Leucogyrophana mollusca TaxID=85980 RepID=A0ACB8BZJ9_9AGAM|nr:hypothetical protein BV22DRAFT_1101368 [Leucogyrophana mollusca]
MIPSVGFGAAVFLITFAFPSAETSAITSDAGNCSANEFWYETISSCVPYGSPSTLSEPPGGVASPPSPPKGSQCPPSGWYWSNQLACCVPKSLPSSTSPAPQCANGWIWSQTTWKCQTAPSSPTKSYPSHSPSPSSSSWGHSNRKRALKARTTRLCPTGFDACPIAGASDLRDYECIDADVELENCGGCSVSGKGQDCTAIKGVWNVGCVQGSCAVYTCMAGYRPSFNGQSCIHL